MNQWMRNAGRAEKRKLNDLAAAEDQARRDREMVEKLGEGEQVRWRDSRGDEQVGFVLEIVDDRRVAVENWEHGTTLDARKVERVEA